MSKPWRKCWCRSAQDPRTLDRGFLKRLYAFDQGRTRIRWSIARQGWFVERKLWHEKYEPNTTPYWPDGTPRDEWIQARDGYYTVDVLPAAAPLEDFVISNMQFFNLERWGGWLPFEAYVSKLEEQAEERKKREQADRWYAIASDVYDTVKHDLGEAAFVPSPEKGQNTWLNKDTLGVVQSTTMGAHAVLPAVTESDVVKHGIAE